MVSHLAMPNYHHTPEDKERFLRLGKRLYSPSTPVGFFGASETISAGPKTEDVCLMLGMAYVDSFRLIKKNWTLLDPVIEKLLAQDEILGEELEVIWDHARANVKPLGPEDREVWPEPYPESPFYKMGAVEVSNA